MGLSLLVILLLINLWINLTNLALLRLLVSKPLLLTDSILLIISLIQTPFGLLQKSNIYLNDLLEILQGILALSQALLLIDLVYLNHKTVHLIINGPLMGLILRCRKLSLKKFNSLQDLLKLAHYKNNKMSGNDRLNQQYELTRQRYKELLGNLMQVEDQSKQG